MNLQTNTPENAPLKVLKSRAEADPILLELWEVKRQINQHANFDIAQIAQQANAFDVQNAMKKLSVAMAH